MGISVPTKNAPFPPEATVEVKGVEDGFKGSWHLATVVASKAPANKRGRLCGPTSAGLHRLAHSWPSTPFTATSSTTLHEERSRDGGRHESWIGRREASVVCPPYTMCRSVEKM